MRVGKWELRVGKVMGMCIEMGMEMEQLEQARVWDTDWELQVASARGI